MRYGLGNTLVLFGQTRYFSANDYVNATESGILVSDNLAYDIDQCKAAKQDIIEDVIYCTDSQSMLSNNGYTRHIVNVFSLDNFGKSIYLDYYSESGKSTVNEIVSKLKQHGYTLDKNDVHNVIESLLQPTKDFIVVLMAGGITFYILYYIVAYWYFYNMRREISIHYLQGDEFNSMSKRFVKPLLNLSIVFVVVSVVFAIYQGKVGFLVMSSISLLSIYVLQVLLTLIIHSIAFQRIYRSIKNTRGDDCVG